MQLSSEQISQNYQDCYSLTSNLLKQRIHYFNNNGAEESEQIDLIQSVVGHESVVYLIQFTPFDKNIYQPIIEQSIETICRSLFPDVSKKRFFSIDDDRNKFLESSLSVSVSEEIAANQSKAGKSIADILSSELVEYYENILCVKNPHLINSTIRIPREKKQFIKFKKQFNRKIYLFKKFFPDGNLNLKNIPQTEKSLSSDQIIEIYLKVYLDIEKFFPKHFLKTNPQKRSALLVRFLVEEILECRPEQILNQKDETLFIKHKLQNVYRYFNYSCNRALNNAYPELIHPWLNSRTDSEYWQDKQNRICAVKWLVEEKLQIASDQLYKSKINRKDFSQNGLSFLYNTYYNSVTAALSEAYPEKYPWELGNVPFIFWTNENSIAAIKWLIRKKGWNVSDLPLNYKTKELNRKTFSKYGLATLFEKKFNKNIYQAFNLAFPGQFYPWEFGKVPASYWNAQTIQQASEWIARQEGFNQFDVVDSILNKKLTFRFFEKYSIGQVLRKKSSGSIEKLFGRHFWKEHAKYLEEQRILRKIKAQQNRYYGNNILNVILYGFFAKQVAKTHQRQQRAYRRISNRISSGYYL